eukprot:CAMPEP_0172526482 /NCGR_PEP_ID=MMETSP1067-20121228/1404_1 /TAXON_ID=265564 ORGANISM="Thalassiosira punctigera, Strain Tpunct2005C2" /NCGR_SAMPLE_ID=MMETSP1067 /ASSEMBLY_ACC=CAM_ASM_000444 /LENGTH=298 /DNA_ID=CAMNT_0013310013 /DNA_START=49 /DNA_END=945 /DNA_ORIENTATION=+
MAPHQDEFKDNNGHSPSVHENEIIVTKEELALDSINFSVCGDSCGQGKGSPRRKTMRRGVEPSMPESILRRSKYTVNNDSDDIAPAHWPRPRCHSVRFPSSSSVVTAVHTRPRTHILDVPSLYYSPHDTRRFKREYRQLLRSQTVARERMEWNSRQKVDHPQHDNSFWRSKVGRRWSFPSAAAAAATSCKNDNSPTASVTRRSHETNTWDPLNDGSVVSSIQPSSHEDDDSDGSEDEIDEIISPPSSGMFSSVFDVAREAVSILNGPSSRSYYQSHEPSSVRNPCTTSLHLVDTLYLF